MFRRVSVLRCSASDVITYQAAYWKPNWYPQVENNSFDSYETSFSPSKSEASSSSAAPPFTVLSYNILSHRFVNARKFPHLAKTVSGNCRYSNRKIHDKNYRLSLIAEQIAEVNPDIVLLQEVAESLVTNNTSNNTNTKTIQQRHPVLRSFESKHFPNTTKEGNDEKPKDANDQNSILDLEGIAMLWNPQRFELQEVETIKLNPHFRWTCTGSEANTRCLPTNNVCSVAVFRDLSLEKNSDDGFGSSAPSCELQQKEGNNKNNNNQQKKLIVAGVHLDYRRGQDFQIRQFEHILDTIRRRYGFERTCPMCPEDAENNTAVMICGDFNLDGCSDEKFEKFTNETAAIALPELTRVEFKSYQSEEKVAENNLVTKNKQNERARQTKTYFDDNGKTGGCCQQVMPIGSNSNDGKSSLGFKYPFASTLSSHYTTGMWVDHCFFTGKSLKCVQHTGLPTSVEEFPILCDSHPSDHCPIGVKMEWK